MFMHGLDKTTTLLRLAYRLRFHLLAATVYGGLGAIFYFHRVISHKSQSLAHRLTISTNFLEQIINRFSNEGVRFLSMNELWTFLQCPIENAVPFLVLTFDDGYRDLVTNALPILRKYAVPATIYVPSGAADRILSPWWLRIERAILTRDEITIERPKMPGRIPTATGREKLHAYKMLTDYVHRDISANQSLALQLLPFSKLSDEALNAEYFCSWFELRELGNDPMITIGGHTISHPVLSDLDEHKAFAEIVQGRDRLSSELNVPIDHFAYPYGTAAEYGSRYASLVAKAGFRTAVTTQRSNIYARHREHLMSLPRLPAGRGVERIEDVVLERSGLTALYSRYAS